MLFIHLFIQTKYTAFHIYPNYLLFARGKACFLVVASGILKCQQKPQSYPTLHLWCSHNAMVREHMFLIIEKAPMIVPPPQDAAYTGTTAPALKTWIRLDPD